MSPAAAFSLWLGAIWLVVVVAGGALVIWAKRKDRRRREIIEHSEAHWR